MSHIASPTNACTCASMCIKKACLQVAYVHQKGSAAVLVFKGLAGVAPGVNLRVGDSQVFILIGRPKPSIFVLLQKVHAFVNQR